MVGPKGSLGMPEMLTPSSFLPGLRGNSKKDGVVSLQGAVIVIRYKSGSGIAELLTSTTMLLLVRKTFYRCTLLCCRVQSL